MTAPNKLFFCALGGSGMLPLALIMKARGHEVIGSDRSFDQGRTPERFAAIEQQGLKLFPQDGSGVTADVSRLVISAAVEQTVPDVQAAQAQGIPIVTRAQLLAEIFNQTSLSIGVAGTSGKSTTTGMIGWILHQAGKRPTLINGASMKNFVTPQTPFANAVVGDPALVVAEVDESDGSIAHFTPRIAVLNNLSLDHKSIEELRVLFGDYIRKAQTAIVNLDNDEAAALAQTMPPEKLITFSLQKPDATLIASDISMTATGMRGTVTYAKEKKTATLALPQAGRHNIANALAALGAALAAGVSFEDALNALEKFTGIARRLDVIGTTSDNITVIDDFAHNPDKIAASLQTLCPMAAQTGGTLRLLFQPHGFGPLKLMRRELAACFAQGLRPQDQLWLCEPLYLGGTTDRAVTSHDLIQDIVALGHPNTAFLAKEEAVRQMVNEARKGDVLVIMGARDDTLPLLARQIFQKLAQGSP